MSGIRAAGDKRMKLARAVSGTFQLSARTLAEADREAMAGIVEIIGEETWQVTYDLKVDCWTARNGLGDVIFTEERWSCTWEAWPPYSSGFGS